MPRNFTEDRKQVNILNAKKAFFSFLSLMLLIVLFLEKPHLFVLISYFYVFYVSTLLHIHLKKSDAFIRLWVNIL